MAAELLGVPRTALQTNPFTTKTQTEEVQNRFEPERSFRVLFHFTHDLFIYFQLHLPDRSVLLSITQV